MENARRNGASVVDIEGEAVAVNEIMEVPEQDNRFYKRWPLEIRCTVCGKMFCKLYLIVGCSEPDVVTVKEKLIDHLTKTGIDVKIGLETRCRRCETLDTKILVVGRL